MISFAYVRRRGYHHGMRSSLRHAIHLIILAAFAAFVPTQVAAAQNATPAATAPSRQAQKFLRFVDDGHQGGELQSAIVTLKRRDGITLDLIAAIHIADKDYYAELNTRFKAYDAVLYEMVKPKDAPAPTHEALAESTSTISMLQRFMKNSLQLDFQLDDIDYTRPNFIHADLDSETFYRLQAERGESMLSLLLNTMMHALASPPAVDPNSPPPPEPTLADLIRIFTDPDGPRLAKLILARQFNDIERIMSGLAGPNGSVILTERNKAALKALTAAIADGHKHIAIFYGAAHMPELESHAVKEFHFQPVKATWITAWKMPAPESAPAGIPAAPEGAAE